MTSWQHLRPTANIWSEFRSICRQKWNQFQTTNHQELYQFYNLHIKFYTACAPSQYVQKTHKNVYKCFEIKCSFTVMLSTKISESQLRNFPTLKSQGGSSKTGWSGYFLGCHAAVCIAHKTALQMPKVITPISGGVGPLLITGRGPLCGEQSQKQSMFFFSKYWWRQKKHPLWNQWVLVVILIILPSLKLTVRPWK